MPGLYFTVASKGLIICQTQCQQTGCMQLPCLDPKHHKSEFYVTSLTQVRVGFLFGKRSFTASNKGRINI